MSSAATQWLVLPPHWPVELRVVEPNTCQPHRKHDLVGQEEELVGGQHSHHHVHPWLFDLSYIALNYHTIVVSFEALHYMLDFVSFIF